MKIFHFNTPLPTGNFGDDVQQAAMRKMFEDRFSREGEVIEWTTFPLRLHITDPIIERANESDLILLGGGGLILPDTVPDSWSGWQWNIRQSDLAKFKKPLIVASIGDNLFFGQRMTNRMIDHLRQLAQCAAFFGMRTQSDCRTWRGNLDCAIEYMPCPSLFWKMPARKIEDRKPILGINLAMDRWHLRLDSDRLEKRSEFGRDICSIANAFKSQGWSIRYLEHSWSQERNRPPSLYPSIDEIFDLSTTWPDRLQDISRKIDLYRECDVVLAMRGHGCMIPWSHGVPTIGLMTHRKIPHFFIDVFGAPEWIVSPKQKDWVDTAISAVEFSCEPDQCRVDRSRKAFARMRQAFDACMDQIVTIWRESK